MILLLARLLLAAIFAVAGAAKLLDLAATRRTLAEFGMPERVTPAAAVALPLVELATAALLIPAATGTAGALLGLALLLVFVAVVARSLRRGETPDCNCFGGVHSSPVGPSTLVRNMLLAAVAAAVAFAGPGEGLGALDGASVLAAAAALAGALLLGLTWFSWQLFQQNGRLLVRVRALEEATSAAGTLPGADLPAPPATGGLPQGELAPDLTLATPGGGVRSVLDLARMGRPPIALVFSDPACRGCRGLTERLPDLREELGGVLEPVLVTREAGPHADAAAASGLTVLVQEDREALFAFALGAVPAAVVLDAEGRVASETAVGPDAVEELLRSTVPVPALEVVQATGGVR